MSFKAISFEMATLYRWDLEPDETGEVLEAESGKVFATLSQGKTVSIKGATVELWGGIEDHEWPLVDKFGAFIKGDGLYEFTGGVLRAWPKAGPTGGSLIMLVYK